jgi:ssDNA thymidine ADP-ribosyltransferase DarT-like protein
MDLNHFLTEVLGKSPQHQKLYHFTDRKNLPLIRQHGLLSTSELRRQNIFDSVKPGGDTNSLNSDLRSGTDGYVCLCFTRNHPMVHVATNDHRKLDATYLEIDPKVIKLPNVMITSAPSNQAGIARVAAAAALDTLDLDVIYKRMDWTIADVQARLSISTF